MKLLCQLGIHQYIPFSRTGEVNWILMTFRGKRCLSCGKEKIKEIL